MRLYLYCLMVVLFILPAEIQAQVYYTESGHAEFDSSVPLHSFTGESDQLVGQINLADSTVDFYVDVHTLETGIGKRDDDMLETLEAEKYPFAELYGKLTSGFDPESAEPQDVTVEGDFTIHGETNPVVIEGVMEKTEEGVKISASWTINMQDYNIKPPGILFYRVSEEVDASISAIVTPKKQAKR